MMIALVSVQISAQGNQDKREFLNKAYKAYYNLKDQGFNGFKCTVDTDWKRLIEENFIGVGDQYAPLNLLSAIEFSSSLDKDGAAKIEPFSHDGGEIDRRLGSSIASVQQIITVFYQTWTSLTVASPLPGPNDNFTLTGGEDGYLITVDNSNSQIAMTKDFQIVEIRVQVQNSNIIIRPKYASTDKGWILTSLSYEINKGQMKFDFDIKYQDVNGLQLPGSVFYKATMPNRTVVALVVFSKYHLTKQ
jgi:hypothetical protein